jgi:hypothetical protein
MWQRAHRFNVNHALYATLNSTLHAD